jgi:hypothetical protein
MCSDLIKILIVNYPVRYMQIKEYSIKYQEVRQSQFGKIDSKSLVTLTVSF